MGSVFESTILHRRRRPVISAAEVGTGCCPSLSNGRNDPGGGLIRWRGVIHDGIRAMRGVQPGREPAISKLAVHPMRSGLFELVLEMQSNICVLIATVSENLTAGAAL
jgi:hypothetical protein